MIAIDGAGAASGNYLLNWAQAAANPTTFAAILPTARSVTTGQTATAFGSIVNANAVPATGCSLAQPPGFPGTFSYQTTDAQNQLVGTANTPANIAANGTQSFVLAITPSVDLNAADVAIVFDCADTPVTNTVAGLNTLLLASSATPTPDMIAIGATPSNDGISTVPGNGGTTFWAAAVVNIGAAGTITATVDDNGRNLPVTVTVCVSNPATAACVNPPTFGASATFDSATNGVNTFTIQVTGTGNVPFNPANNRLFLRFKTADGVIRGATSVAVRTGAADAQQAAAQ